MAKLRISKRYLEEMLFRYCYNPVHISNIEVTSNGDFEFTVEGPDVPKKCERVNMIIHTKHSNGNDYKQARFEAHKQPPPVLLPDKVEQQIKAYFAAKKKG